MPAHLWTYVVGAALGLAALWWIAPGFAQGVLGIALRVVIGGAVLYGADLVGRPYGVSIGVNPVTASVLGVLGIPGAGVLLLWRTLY